MTEAELEEQDVNDRTDKSHNKLYGALIAIVVLFLAYLLTEILWRFDKAILLFLTIGLAAAATISGPRKLLFHREKASLLGGLIISVLLVVPIWLFNASTIPELAAYRFGVDSSAKIENLNIKGHNSLYIVYNFSVDQIEYTREQGVGITAYDSLKPGQLITIRYLEFYPEASVFIDDGYLKLMLVLSLGISAAMIAAVYSTQIMKRTYLVMQNNKPPNPVL